LREISSGEIGTALKSILMNSRNHLLYGSIDTTMKLNRGEIIYLQIQKEGQKMLENIYLTNPVLFSGSLLEDVIDDSKN